MRAFSNRGGGAAVVLSVLVVAVGAAAAAADVPGTKPDGATTDASRMLALDTQVFAETGRYVLSVDGAGSNAASHVVQVEKPNASATVYKAYLFATTVGYEDHFLDNGDVTIDGNAITWDSVIWSSNGYAEHGRADVTSIVKPKVDAAAAGRVDFTLAEVADNAYIDGEVLAVVFSDPTLTASRTVVLLFGALATTGDTFAITLGQPIDPAAAGALADMGLAIGFSYQASGGDQRSIVDVNGQRMTSAAGGEDDGINQDGGLITVGGLDDSNANPVDPNATPTNPRSDDELYSLLPFITSSATSISVQTSNPTNDDYIFLAYFVLSGSAVVGEGILLSPATATNPVGTQHTLTAQVVDAAGAPIPGVMVTFEVTSGPNDGDTGTATTNVSGVAQWSYTGDGGAGTDTIEARATFGQTTITSNTAEKIWEQSEPAEPIPVLGGHGLLLLVGLVLAAGALVLVRGRLA